MSPLGFGLWALGHCGPAPDNRLPAFAFSRREKSRGGSDDTTRMANGWQIEDRCPQCGGPVTLNETDRLLACAYCQVRLYVATEGVPRYCLPVKPAPVGDIVMVPYWRVRAQHYRCVPWELRSALLDLTRLATPAPGLPGSLGIRPQAVRLRFAAPSLATRFLPASGPPPLPDEHLDAALSTIEEETHLFEACVAASTSIVYAPVRLTRAVFDGVLNRRLAADAEGWVAAAGSGDEAPPPIRFLATLCPACGWQLEAARDSLVLLCVNCRGAWRANHAGLCPVEYSLLDTGGWTPHRHLPFWRVTARISGLPLDSWADLVRFANLPRVVKAEWRDEPLEFWVPGFKAQPDQFLRIAQCVTLARPAHGDTAIRPGTGPDAPPVDGPLAPVLRACYPVTLDNDALAAAVTVLIASLGQPKTRVFQRLREVSVEVTASHLVYVPLDFNGREYQHPSLQLTVQKNLLEWGARL